MLNAFYDFAVSPAKYDFIGFLLDAERYRQLVGEDGIQFVFVPGPKDGFRDDKLPPKPEIRLKMLQNILIPMCGMLGIPAKIYICQSRVEALEFQLKVTGQEIFPTEYRATDPTHHYGMHVMARSFHRKFYPLRAYKPIEPQLDLITITLRECHYWPSRNSNREVWLEAGKVITDAGLRVLFIPDTDSPAIDGDWQATTDLHHRAALYEAAKHNFFVSNGPAWMAAVMPKVNATIFKMVSADAVSCSPKFFRNIGFPIGSQVGRSNHKIIWEDDTLEAVLPRVKEIVGEYDYR